MHICALCNDAIVDIDIQFGEYKRVDDEYWHLECYSEYFDEALQEA